MPPRKPTYTTAKATGGMTHVMGVSHTRIQQIEREAIGKIRRGLAGMDLIPDESRLDPVIYA